MTPISTTYCQGYSLPSGHTVTTDVTGRLHFQSNSTSSYLMERFERAVQRLGKFCMLPRRPALILALPIFDTVLTQQGLRSAGKSLHLIYHQGQHLVLDWNLSHGWRDRRFLSPTTCSILDKFPDAPSLVEQDWREARGLIQEALEESSNAKVWDLFLNCAAAYWYDRLPKLLWSHCIGIEPLQPLKRSTIARRITGFPLVFVPDVQISQPRIDQDAYLSAGIQTKQIFTIGAAVDILIAQRKMKSSRAHFGKAVIPKLTYLLTEAAREGRVQVLIVGFVIDLVLNGGLNGELSINSIISYLSRSFSALAAELLQVDIYSLDATGWWNLYQKVIENCDEKQLSKVYATLGAFHDYLQWLGVPPLQRGFGGVGPTLPPRAEVVWSPESARAVQWLDLQVTDPNCPAAQAALAVLLIDDFMVRIDEVLSLRVGDFKNTLAGISLFLYPRTKDGRMKSDGVRHPIDIKSAELKARLYQWIRMRRGQQAKDDDFLFGAPRKPRERHEHGKTYSLLEMALKIGSGCPNSTSHGSRHRQGSEESEQACMPDTHYVDFNPIDQISARAGQNVTQSLRESYINLFELPLHAHAASAWSASANLTARPIPSWAPAVDFGILLDRDEQWRKIKIPSPAVNQVTFSAVLDVVEDLSLGYSPDSIGSRNALDRSQVVAIARVTATTLFGFNRNQTPRKMILAFEKEDFHAHQYFLVKAHGQVTNARQDKYFQLHDWLDRATKSSQKEALLKKAIVELKSTVKNFYLNAEETGDIASLIQIIQESKTPASRLLITHAVERNSLPNSLMRLGWTLRKEPKVRRGQWRIRLHICSVDADSPAAIDAAISMKGFFALLSAAEAMINLIDTKE